MLKTYVQTTNFLKAKTRNEEGEVASWLILAAGLAIVAGFASGELDRIIRDLVGKVDTASQGNP